MSTSIDVCSGEWSQHADFSDFRSEWLSDVLIERATRAPHSSIENIARVLGTIVIANRDYIWTRFWYRHESQLFEKYFDAQQQPIGIYAPICMPFEQTGKAIRTVTLILGLWIENSGQVTVLGEDEFEQAVTAKQLSPVQIEQAEHQIREMTRHVAAKKTPPAMVRNFTLIPE